MRSPAAAVLEAYSIKAVRLEQLADTENATFRVDGDDRRRYVLRIHRSTGTPFHPRRSPAEVRSELLWLAALRRETDLEVPDPVPTSEGELVTIGDGERIYVLLRWMPGRFLDAGLRPTHLARVGRFMAHLHSHATAFTPPAGFVRGRPGDLSDEVYAHVVDTVAEHCGRDPAHLVATVLDGIRRAQRALGESPDTFGLIHGDLHQENYLFHRGGVAAIDFDDCGWGHFLSDFAVTVSEVSSRPDFPLLRDALLSGYREIRPLPSGYDEHLPAFLALRELQLTLWVLERRDHPKFVGWQGHVDTGLAELRSLATRL